MRVPSILVDMTTSGSVASERGIPVWLEQTPRTYVDGYWGSAAEIRMRVLDLSSDATIAAVKFSPMCCPMILGQPPWIPPQVNGFVGEGTSRMTATASIFGRVVVSKYCTFPRINLVSNRRREIGVPGRLCPIRLQSMPVVPRDHSVDELKLLMEMSYQPFLYPPRLVEDFAGADRLVGVSEARMMRVAIRSLMNAGGFLLVLYNSIGGPSVFLTSAENAGRRERFMSLVERWAIAYQVPESLSDWNSGGSGRLERHMYGLSTLLGTLGEMWHVLRGVTEDEPYLAGYIPGWQRVGMSEMTVLLWLFLAGLPEMSIEERTILLRVMSLVSSGMILQG